MKGRRIRAIASLMACAVLSAQMPVATLNAAQQETVTDETESTETEAAKAEPDEAERDEAQGSEERTKAEPDETEHSEERTKTEPSEEESSEAKSLETEDETEAGETETTETEPAETETETDSSKIRYILGREMTPREIAEQEAMVPAYMPELEVVTLPDSDYRFTTYDLRAEELPKTYDARENGAITAVKNQNPWGTCWTFSFLAAMENSLIRQNYASVDEIDLSERHLAYFDYHTGYDALDNANDDTITTSPQNYYLKNGGNSYRAAAKLMNWQGAALESDYPYSNSTSVPEDLEREMAQDMNYTLKGCYFIETKSMEPAEKVQTIKELIMEYDCVAWSYYHSSTFYNASTAAYFNNEVKKTNHAITVVGWDDTYAKENFKTSPENDGAWIVRNSWGSSWGDDGYFYVSYEDVSMGCSNAACVVTAGKAGIYDNNYFHGNTSKPAIYGSYQKVAQIYQAKSPNATREKISAISFMISSSAQEYSIQLYKNPEHVDGVVKDPESGTPVLEKPLEGTTTYAGVYTVALPELVLFEDGDEIAIVISFPEDHKAKMFCDVSEQTSSTTGSCEAVNVTQPGESMYVLSSGWQDSSKNERSFRINMLTDDQDPVYPAVPELTAAEYQEKAVRLQWTEASGAEGYFVERSDNAGDFVKLAKVEGAASLEYTDDSITKGNTYTYRIIACNTDITGDILESEVSNTQEVILYPDPVSIASATAVRAGIVITLPEIEQAHSYQLYRSETGAEGEYTLIADPIIDTAYTDSAVKPDTTYFYKVLVTMNGLQSLPADTTATEITSRPLLIGLSLSVAEQYMEKDTSQALLLSAEPAHYPYQDELTWSAFDEDGDSLPVSAEGGTIVVTGNDGKEILRIADNQITAIGDSEDRTVRLAISIEEIKAECTISIYKNGFWVAGVKSQTYTGKALTPKIRVYDRTRLLTEGTDYSVSYKNNINANDASNSAKAPTITVKGKGNYSGTEVVTFQILPEDISGWAFRSDNIACAYDAKKVQHPVPELYRNDTKLKYNKDFTVSYPETAQDAYKAVGAYRILITGKGNYCGTREITLTITDEGLISKTTVAKVKDQPYTGNPVEPKLTVKLGKDVLKEDQDYIVTYENNILPGTATAVITGNGTTYHGTKRVSFKITGSSLKKATVAGLEKSLGYTGGAVKQTGYQLSIRTAAGTLTLTEGTDYQVSYTNHTNAGTATITFTGINGYTGTLKKTYKITAYDIGNDSGKHLTIQLPEQVPYAKGGSRPEPMITFDGKALTYGTDYKLSYRNNITVASDKKTPQVVITGIKNFKGTRTLSYAITKQDIGLLTIKASDKVYSSKAGAYKTKLSIMDLDGKTLTAGKDYAKVFDYTYAAPTTLADGSRRGEGEPVGNTDVIPCGTVLRVTVTGLNNYTGTLTGEYRITEYDISKAKVSVESQIYTGQEIRPDETDISVTFQGRKLTYGTDYVIEGYTDNVKKGTAKVVLRGIGNFGGTKTASFKIKSKTVLWWM